ncbi:hypothetical protein ACOKW7_18625 [Limnospira platensis CENA597]|uniref:hypothetical protein n=1 Tax=Limnospira platensis TaxID=118562 RepID=UPI003DA03B4D
MIPLVKVIKSPYQNLVVRVFNKLQPTKIELIDNKNVNKLLGRSIILACRNTKIIPSDSSIQPKFPVSLGKEIKATKPETINKTLPAVDILPNKLSESLVATMIF